MYEFLYFFTCCSVASYNEREATLEESDWPKTDKWSIDYYYYCIIIIIIIIIIAVNFVKYNTKQKNTIIVFLNFVYLFTDSLYHLMTLDTLYLNKMFAVPSSPGATTLVGRAHTPQEYRLSGCRFRPSVKEKNFIF